jgi:hypothetical protein
MKKDNNMELTERENKRFAVLLINSRAIYWGTAYAPTHDYIGEIHMYLSWKHVGKKYKKCLTELKDFISSHGITNEDIHEFIKTMDNPREAWNDRMKEHNNGGRETRDNKGQFVSYCTYATPYRYPNGNIEMCRFNKIRYPKKCRSLRTWKLFYKMFPKQAEIDNWDGKTSDKMK